VEAPSADQTRALLSELEKVIEHFDDNRHFVRDS
jgi:hypothetical protein